MSDKNSLFYYIRPFAKRFALALLFMVMVALFVGLFAFIIQLVMDELFIQSGGELSRQADNNVRQFILKIINVDQAKLFLVLPQLLFLSFLGNALFSFLSLYLMKTLGLKVVMNIRQQLYRTLIYQSIDFLSKSKTGDLVSRLSNDIEKVKFAVSETLSVFVKETLTVIVLLLVIFYQDWYMAMISLLIIPVAATLLKVFSSRVEKRVIQSQETIGELSNYLNETVAGNKIVKAYNMQDEEIKKFSKLNWKHFKINSKIDLIYSFTSPIMHVMGGLVAAIIFTIGMTRISNGMITPGQFTSFLASLFIMYDPIKRLSRATNDYRQGKAGFSRVQQIIANENTVQDGPDAIELASVQGAVTFEKVNFSYDNEQPVLKDISFNVGRGEMIALVGKSGAGKTTLMNLMLRFYESDSGRILIDGLPIDTCSFASLRRAIGLVTQDVFLFNDTVFNNIAYGFKSASMEQVKRAAEIARAAEFIECLADGYYSMVGERGVFLSTGQRQRISIARAILREPAILIFDEATSSLDTESEKLIQEAMVEVMKSRTTFVIAHRLATIIEADRILVMSDGTIIEAGNHRDLLSRKGAYYSLYNLQFPDMDIIM